MLALVLLKERYAGFDAQAPEDYAQQGPQFDLREHLNGAIKCEGVIYGPLGRVASRFTGDFEASWQGNRGVMREHFDYDSGNAQDREWQLELGNDGSIRAEAEDLVGTGTGQQMGAAARLCYRIRTRVMMPIALMVGAYIFLRGHNQPGGGFIAGLIVAIAFLMQYMASGFAWAEARQRVTYHATIGVGVLIASVTGIGAWLAGRPFLTSDYGYLHFPPIEEFEWATAMAFDTGVFLTVVGAVMLALNSLSSMARRSGETVNIMPMDINPALNDAPDEKEA
jgi:monovalent cation:proton antiporter